MAKKISKVLNRETDRRIYFYTPKFYCFDSFSSHQVKIWGKKFPTAEHAFQWKKFEHSKPEIAKEIMGSESPHLAKDLATKNKSQRINNWDDIKVSVMKEIIVAKHSQHKDIQEKLRLSGSRILIENSPTDSFWGIGPNNKGQNIIGKIWMSVRNDSTLPNK